MAENTKKINVKWHELDQSFAGLETGFEHRIVVQREAVPLVFVPGIMGSRLRLRGTSGTAGNWVGLSGKERGLPDMRWNPTGTGLWMGNWFSILTVAGRRRMIVGKGNYSSNYLEVHNSAPVGDGYQGLYDNYYGFLDFLKQKSNWGPLNKIFVFPVYAVGYNWTDTNYNSGKKLAKRIDEIILESKESVGSCEKVIVLTHSMGGLVARSASELHGGRSKILGIIHGVQPVTGAPPAYWRMKGGNYAGSFLSKANLTAHILGDNGPSVTAILANIPGGLELLPNKHYRTNTGQKKWLRVVETNKAQTLVKSTLVSLPENDPYTEIYQVKGTGDETKNPGRKVWGLVDPDYINPGRRSFFSGPDALCQASKCPDPDWENYLRQLTKAERFHNKLKKRAHPYTFTFLGSGHSTGDAVEMYARENSRWSMSSPSSYPEHGFQGFFKRNGDLWKVELGKPAGDGDETVPYSSGAALKDSSQITKPVHGITHEPAYNDSRVQEFVVKCVAKLCKRRYQEKRP